MFVVALATTPVASAQDRPVDSASSQTRKGSVKIWIGSAMVVAGAIAIPVTATDAAQQPSDFAVAAGVGLVGAGGALSGPPCRTSAVLCDLKPQCDSRLVAPTRCKSVGVGKRLRPRTF